MDDEDDLRAAAGAPGAKTRSRKSRKPKEKEPDEQSLAEEDDLPPVPKKKERKRKEPEPVEEPENEEDEQEEGEEEAEGDDSSLTPEQIKKKKEKALRNSREHKKCSGFRKLARGAGYNRTAGATAAKGVDMFRSCITKDDAKRLMQYFPEVTKDTTYEKDEALERNELSHKHVPAPVAREAQAFLEPVFRHCMNEALMRAIEDGTNGKKSVAASHMYSVIRKFAPYMRYTAVLPPKGLIKHAVKQGSLTQNEADQDSKVAAKEKEETSSINKELKRMAKEAQERANQKAERIRLAKEKREEEAQKKAQAA